MIEKFIKTLKNAGLTKLTPEEIADILWLAEHLEQEERDADSGDLPGNDTREPEPPQKQAVSPEPPAETEMPGTGVYRPESESESGMGGIPFRSPGTPALPGELSVARSFRPLMRRVPSRTQVVLDEEATVRRIADEGNWIPAYRPARSRWLDVVLLVDEWSSMVIWRQTIAELQRLLERQGAFRNVQVWGFSVDGESDPVLHVGTGSEASENMARSPGELNDPCGRRLILMVSDCVSPAWYDGRVARMMTNWTDHTMVAVLQMLPYRLWGRTGLGKAASVCLRGLNPGTVNAKLETESTRKIFRKKIPREGVKVPVITLEPGRLNCGRGHWREWGVCGYRGLCFKRLLMGRRKSFRGFLINRGKCLTAKPMKKFRLARNQSRKPLPNPRKSRCGFSGQRPLPRHSIWPAISLPPLSVCQLCALFRE